MNQIFRPLYAIALTLWVGALWAIGGIAAPTLFSALSDHLLAGMLAGRMFVAVAWIGIGCGAYLMLHQAVERGWQAFRSPAFWIVLLMFVLTLAGHFGIEPVLRQIKNAALPREVMQSVVRDRFLAWHGISSALYVVQCALGGALVVLEFTGLARGSQASPSRSGRASSGRRR
ncbi:DUF4149 domain-containing protein [Niveibacterium terrae]|uniref:DUF4149 domain-containing protein n=1 Tax=Niveibacterium terrae TaxID=3373598 RepID=UPI003A9128FB